MERGGKLQGEKPRIIIIKPSFFNQYEEIKTQNLLLSCDRIGNSMVLSTVYGCNERCKHALLLSCKLVVRQDYSSR